MQPIIEFFTNLTDPEWIMRHGGLYIVVLIVFVETGLFFGVFLPGDSLLFIAGMVIANSLSPFTFPVLNLLYWIVLIATAGVFGYYAGYFFGTKSDRFLLQRKDNWIFKKKYLYQAKDFYDRKGGGAIVLARFLPIVRTFAPIVAGMVKMKPGKFSFYNIIGSIVWAGIIVSAGFFSGQNDWAKENVEKIIIGIGVVTFMPIFIKLIIKRKRNLKPVSV